MNYTLFFIRKGFIRKWASKSPLIFPRAVELFKIYKVEYILAFFFSFKILFSLYKLWSWTHLLTYVLENDIYC